MTHAANKKRDTKKERKWKLKKKLHKLVYCGKYKEELKLLRKKQEGKK